MSITIMIFFITININNDDHHPPGIQSSKAVTTEEGVAKTEARDRQGVHKDLGNVQKIANNFNKKNNVQQR